MRQISKENDSNYLIVVETKQDFILNATNIVMLKIMTSDVEGQCTNPLLNADSGVIWKLTLKGRASMTQEFFNQLIAHEALLKNSIFMLAQNLHF